MNRIGALAGCVGRGLFAGAFGTAVMTVSSTIEMKMRNREGSSAPVDAAGKVLGVEPTDEAGQERFSNLVHFGYGTGWGAVRGLIGFLGLRAPATAAAHMGAVWGSEMVMLPVLDVAPPATKGGGPKKLRSTGSTMPSMRARLPSHTSGCIGESRVAQDRVDG